MLKLHRIPESTRREAPSPVSRDFPLIVSRGLPMAPAVEVRPIVRPKTDERPAEVLNLLTRRDAKHSVRVFEGAAITGWGDNLGGRS